jgi:hypothetical protein
MVYTKFFNGMYYFYIRYVTIILDAYTILRSGIYHFSKWNITLLYKVYNNNIVFIYLI